MVTPLDRATKGFESLFLLTLWAVSWAYMTNSLSRAPHINPAIRFLDLVILVPGVFEVPGQGTICGDRH